MKVQQTLLLCLFISAITAGCKGSKTEEVTYQTCTNDWFLQLENQLSTGDDQGHGPDIGSLEWRSVIEFKLGIRDDPELPSLESRHWCDYINKHIILDLH